MTVDTPPTKRTADVRVILLPDHRVGRPPQRWFKLEEPCRFGSSDQLFISCGDESHWIRGDFCGQFRDGTPRPPWHDDLFLKLWHEEGPDAAHDKSRYPNGGAE